MNRTGHLRAAPPDAGTRPSACPVPAALHTASAAVAWVLAAVPAGAAPPFPGPAAADSVVRIVLPAAGADTQPVEIPVAGDNSVALSLPAPLSDWAGRGFTPDPERYAGTFEIEARRGDTHLWVTPLSASAVDRRILHLVLRPPGRPPRALTLEFIAASPDLAWHSVTLCEPDGDADPAAPAGLGPTPTRAARPAPAFRLADRPPPPTYRQPGADSELGLLRTMRLLLNLPAALAPRLLAANPALSLADHSDEAPMDFGTFLLSVRFALRDRVTDSLGLCVEVRNPGAERLFFDARSWVVRAGGRVYPISTVDFPGQVGPHSQAIALLVLGRGPEGEPTRLLPDSALEPSVVPLGSSAARPVETFPLGEQEAAP